MGLLTKADILAVSDLPTKDIEVPEWGGTIRIRSLTSAQVEDLQAEFMAARDDGRLVPQHWRAKHLALSAVDEAGALLFTEAEASKLAQKSGVAMGRVFDAINTFNGQKPGAVEDAAKN
jgi:hypothetical protein